MRSRAGTGMAVGRSTTFRHNIVSNAANIAINIFYLPIIVGYDSKQGYLPLLKHFICLSALLQRRRRPDEVKFGMAASNTLAPYRIQRCEMSQSTSSSCPL